MPLYEFFCGQCEQYFEHMTSFEDVPLCPMCNGTDVQRILSAPHIKSSAMPFKPGPVHPIANQMSRTSCATGGCSGGQGVT